MVSSASASSSSSLGKRPAPGGDQSAQEKKRLDEQQEGEEAAKRQEYARSLGSLDTLLAGSLSLAEREKLQQARNSVQEALDQRVHVLDNAHGRKVQQGEGKYDRIKAEKKKKYETELVAIRRTETTSITPRPPRSRLAHQGQATNSMQPQQSQQRLQWEEDDEEEEEVEGKNDESKDSQETEDEQEQERHWMHDEGGRGEEEQGQQQQLQENGETEEEEDEEKSGKSSSEDDDSDESEETDDEEGERHQQGNEKKEGGQLYMQEEGQNGEEEGGQQQIHEGEETEDEEEGQQQQLQEEEETEEEEEDHQPLQRRRRRRRRRPDLRRPALRGHAIVNKRIWVHWPRDRVYYSGVVTKYHPRSGEHTVKYDDGTVEKLDLSRKTIRWPDEEEEEEEESGEEHHHHQEEEEGVGGEEENHGEHHQCHQQQQQQQQQQTQGQVATVSLTEALGQGRKLPAMVLEDHMLPCLNDRDRFSLARVSKTLQAAVSSPAAWTETRRLDVTCSSGYTCRDTVSQRGRRSRSLVANDMTKGLCRYLALPQFFQMDAVYLRVKIIDSSLFTATLLERFPHMKTLLLDGSGAYSRDLGVWHWSLPPIFGMFERLETLRELQFPLATTKCKSLFSHIPHVQTLHLANQGDLDEAELKRMLTNTHLPNIRVSTLVAFEKLNYPTLKCILLTFPQLKMLSLRYTYLQDEIVTLRERVMADHAFAGRADGWFDIIAFDLDDQLALRSGQEGWLRQDLFAYDDMTGEVKQSVGDLIKTYNRHYIFRP